MKRAVVVAAIVIKLLFLLIFCSNNSEIGNVSVFPQPVREGAVIIPAQGGAMLFEFIHNSHIGLVNDLGELVTEPRYNRIQYIECRYGWVQGLFAWQEDVIFHYDLYGNATELPFTANWIFPSGNGGFWALGHDDNGAKSGIFDVQRHTFAIELTDRLVVNRYNNGMFFLTQFDSNDGVSHSFYYCTRTRRSRNFPSGYLGSAYFPHHRFIRISRNSDTSWNSTRFITRGGRAVNFRGFEVNALENYHSVRSIGNLRMTSGIADFAFRLFDADGNLLFTRDSGLSDRSVTVHELTTNTTYLALLTREYDVIRMWDIYSGEVINTEEKSGLFYFDFYETSSMSRHRGFCENSVKVLDYGEWRGFDFLEIAREYIGDEFIVRNFLFETSTINGNIIFLLANERHNDRTIAIDWNGNIMHDHPLLPFYEGVRGLGLYWSRINHATPNFFSVDYEGKHGIINSRGEWVFVLE